MKRIPEKPLMENPLQARVYAEADFGETDRIFINRLEEFLFKNQKDRCDHNVMVDLGCGPGNITERLISRWPNSTVIGLDGSQAMISIAKERQSACRNLSKIKYRRFFLCSEQLKSSSFNSYADIVVSNSLLHHYPEPHSFWEVTKTIGSPGAFIYHRDLIRPCDELALSVEHQKLGDAHQILKEDYLASLRASFTVDEVKDQLLTEGLHNLNVITKDYRYLEVFGNL